MKIVRMIIENSGEVELLEQKHNTWKNDLICFLNNCNSDKIFLNLFDKVMNCDFFSINELSMHLIFLINKFGEPFEVQDIVQQIQNSFNKPMILGVAKKIYQIISKKSDASNRSNYYQ
jgi:hypothetical protein